MSGSQGVVEVPEVEVTAEALPEPPPAPPGPDLAPDELSLIVAGRRWRGWKDVLVTRGCERMPSTFQISVTERFPGDGDLPFLPGEPCIVQMGNDTIITGRIDRYLNSVDARQHGITITGRSRARELVDCAAIIPGWQISGQTVKGIASLLAGYYDIEVSAPTGDGPVIPQLNLMPSETVYSVLERLSRFAKMMVYDDEQGNVVLSAVGTEKHASGARQGVNVISASTTLAADQRYSEYWVYLQSTTSLFSQLSLATGGSGMPPPAGLAKDEGVKNRRILIVLMEHAGPYDTREIAQQRAEWEAARRRGRAEAIRVRLDSWRDSAGKLWRPNTRMAVHMPACKVSNAEWIIAEVTFRRGLPTGTVADLLLMPPAAFDPAYVPFLPYNLQIQEAVRTGIEQGSIRPDAAQNRRSAPGP